MSTELIEVTKAVAEFDRVAAGIGALRQKYAGVLYDVSTTAGMKEATAARLAIREPRFEVERIRKAAKAPILALGKRLDTEAARITTELLRLEEPIDQIIKAEEDRKERERLAKIAAEKKRVADIQERIGDIKGALVSAVNRASADIQEFITETEAFVIDDSFAEFRDDAQQAKDDCIRKLREMHEHAVAMEVERERLRKERAELAQQRAEEEKHRAAERARLAEEERVARIAREAEQAKQAELLRQQRAEQEKTARVERERLAAERAELNRQQEELRKAQGPKPTPAVPTRRGRDVKVPTATEMVAVLATHYRARPDTIIDWLKSIDWTTTEAA